MCVCAGAQQLFVWEPDSRKCTLDVEALGTACAGEYYAQCLSFLASSQQDEQQDEQTTGFAVVSGPCTLAEGGRCVGRSSGYLPDERCEITVVGAGGQLGPCPAFDTSTNDRLTLPDGSTTTGSECPVGVVLTGGQAMHWASNNHWQGNNGNGLPQSRYSMGGGWQVCFA